MIDSGTIYLGTHLTDGLVQIVEAITISNGKRTDMGRHGVLVNVNASELLEFPGAIVAEGAETGLDDAGGLAQTEIEYSISVFDKSAIAEASNHPDKYAPHAIMGNMIADIREALENPGCRTIGGVPVRLSYVGATRYPPSEGGEIFGVEVVYTITFSCVHGQFDRTP